MGSWRNFLGLIVLIFGLLAYLIVLSIPLNLGIFNNANIYSWPTQYLMLVISVISILGSSVYLSFDLKQKIANLGGVLFFVSFLMMIYSLAMSQSYELNIVSEMLFLLSLLLIIGQSNVVAPFTGEEHINGESFGRVLKGSSLAFALIWILNKIVNLVIINVYFLNQDILLASVMGLYIIGSSIESFSLATSTGGILSGIRSSFFSAFTASLMMVVLSYILMGVRFTSPTWQFYHGKLLYITLVLFIGSIILYLISPTLGKEYVRKSFSKKFSKIEVVSDRHEIYVARRNGELDLTDNFTALVDSGSIIVPIKTEGDKINGLYILGGGTYKVITDVGKYSGGFDRLWMLWDNADLWGDIEKELKLTTAGQINIAQAGFLSGRALLDFVEKEIERIKYKMEKKKKSEVTHIKLPFIEIYEGPDKEMVKIGPLVVYESDKLEYVNIGPWRIVEERKTSLGSKRSARRYQKVKGGPKLKIGIHDTVRGEISITVGESGLELVTKSEAMKIAPGYLKVVRGEDVLTKSDDAISIKLSDGLILKAERGKFAKLVRNGNIVKVDSSGEIKVIKAGKVIKSYDPDLALRIIDRIYETGEKLLRKAMHFEGKEEITELVSYLDRLIKEEG